MGDTSFNGGDYRAGYGEEDLVDLNDMGEGDDWGMGGPSDSYGNSMIGAEDLTDGGIPGGGDGPYANVNAAQDNSPWRALEEFFAKEFSEGLSAFGTMFSESIKVLGQLPIGSLGGMWAGWILLSVILFPIGGIGGLITRHFINHAVEISKGLATAHTIFSACFSSSLLLGASGVIFGFFMTLKLKQGDKTLAGVEPIAGPEDAEADAEDGFAPAEDCVDMGDYNMGEGGDMPMSMPQDSVDPYSSIIGPAETPPEPEAIPEDTRRVVVQNQAPEVISRSLDNISSMAVVGDPMKAFWGCAMDILPCYSPNFTIIKSLDSDSEQWKMLEGFILNSIKIVTNAQDDDITTRIIEVKRSALSYSIKASRFSKLNQNKLVDFDKELAGFITAGLETDKKGAKIIGDKPKVTCHTEAVGNVYNISVLMPMKKLVSLGDVYRSEQFEEFRTGKTRMPMCLGLSSTGEMLLYDVKDDNSVMLCGETRSGKSWFIAYYMLNLMCQQSPLEHQFLLVDPKNTGLFASLGLMPHVMGVHLPDENDPNSPLKILSLLQEIVIKEGERRKALFHKEGFENYWDYTEAKGKDSLPLITVALDEWISTIDMFRRTKTTLGEDKTQEFMALINNLCTKLPAYGIRLIIIPHRVAKYVDPLTRDMMKFKATFRSDMRLAETNLGLDKVTIDTPNVGDMCWISSMNREPLYTHTLCVGENDEVLKNTILLLAKAYYKLGIEVPDMSYLKSCFNRNDEEIVKTIKSFKK